MGTALDAAAVVHLIQDKLDERLGFFELGSLLQHGAQQTVAIGIHERDTRQVERGVRRLTTDGEPIPNMLEFLHPFPGGITYLTSHGCAFPNSDHRGVPHITTFGQRKSANYSVAP